MNLIAFSGGKPHIALIETHFFFSLKGFLRTFTLHGKIPAGSLSHMRTRKALLCNESISKLSKSKNLKSD